MNKTSIPQSDSSSVHSITYRTASIDEADRIAALSSELFCETFAHLYTEENLQAFLKKVHSVEGVRADMEAGRIYWVAESEGRWVGFCKCGPVGVPVEVGDRRAVELKQLYVRKEYHGAGISHQLMRFFFEWARQQNAEDVYVSCWSENFRGLAFYKKYGFEVVGSYLFWVGDHADDERILKMTMAKS